MSLGPFDVTPVIARLRSQVPAFKVLGGAADRATAQRTQLLATPAAFVILARESKRSESVSGVMRHIVSARIDILVCVRHYQDGQRGDAHADQGIQLVGAVRAALQGWTPAGPDGAGVDPMYSKGDAALLALTDNEWWWVEPFHVDYRSRR